MHRALQFQDASFAPEMVVISSGRFMMGSASSDGEGRVVFEEPRHEVAIDYNFAVSRFAVTLGEFEYFIERTGYRVSDKAHTYENNEWKERDGRSFRFPGFEQTSKHPAVCVSWRAAKAYVVWLEEMTGQAYRLLSEAEWEYSCRAGTETPFWWGADVTEEHANYGYNVGATLPVDAFEPNPWGLYNVHGNVWEWCEDTWTDSYENAPRDGSALVDELEGDLTRVIRGGSWNNMPQFLRSAQRKQFVPADMAVNIGFRVARTL